MVRRLLRELVWRRLSRRMVHFVVLVVMVIRRGTTAVGTFRDGTFREW